MAFSEPFVGSAVMDLVVVRYILIINVWRSWPETPVSRSQRKVVRGQQSSKKQYLVTVLPHAGWNIALGNKKLLLSVHGDS